MVSVWGELCQDCQKQKSEIFKLKGDKGFNHILLKEHAIAVNNFLCCNDCSQMLKVEDDPIYKTLKKKRQQNIFKFVKLFPFPKSIKSLKEEFLCKEYYVRTHHCNENKLTKKIFTIVKDVYENLFIDWGEEKDKLEKSIEKTTQELNKKGRKNPINNSDAFLYIVNLIQTLMKIYERKSEWGTTCGCVRHYQYPSYRKFRKFSFGRLYMDNDIVYRSLVRGTR